MVLVAPFLEVPCCLLDIDLFPGWAGGKSIKEIIGHFFFVFLAGFQLLAWEITIGAPDPNRSLPVFDWPCSGAESIRKPNVKQMFSVSFRQTKKRRLSFDHL